MASVVPHYLSVLQKRCYTYHANTTLPSDRLTFLRNDKHVRPTFVSEILLRVAPRIGATIELEPIYGFVGEITFKSGKKVLYKDRNFNVNPQGSSEIARDKAYSSYFLRRFGYSVPRETQVFSDRLNRNVDTERTMEDGYAFAKNIGLPVIVKPNNLSQGTLVTKVYDKREYKATVKQILRRTSIAIVQEYVPGRDYRVVVLGNEVISAYERTPLRVTGDGTSTVAELLIAKQLHFNSIGRETTVPIDDNRIEKKLKRQGLSLDSIPMADTTLDLLDAANLSTGGDALDVTSTIHQSVRDLAVSVARDMGLMLCGVDLITEVPLTDRLGQYYVIEVNSAPGLDNYAALGAEQMNVVDELYLKVLSALEP